MSAVAAVMGSAIVAQFVNVLALNAHCLGERGLGQPHWLHELLDQNFASCGGRALRCEHGSPHLVLWSSR
jgi:hypothetical protein